MPEITEETTLKEVLEKEEILKKHGVPCIDCPMAKMEMDRLKIGEICKIYGIDSKKLLKDLNEFQR